jgi:hypothetical protein
MSSPKQFNRSSEVGRILAPDGLDRVLDRQTVWIYPKIQERKARRPEIPFPQFSQVFWFLFWFDGDLIHFQTTILNRVGKADSPETFDSIDDFQRNPEKRLVRATGVEPITFGFGVVWMASLDSEPVGHTRPRQKVLRPVNRFLLRWERNY